MIVVSVCVRIVVLQRNASVIIPSVFFAGCSAMSSTGRRSWEPVIIGKHDFGGSRVHVVQIGLGTNCTFIQNFAGSNKCWDAGIHWVLQSVSTDLSPLVLTGVAVEPVVDHAKVLVPMMEFLPNVAMVQCAIGYKDDVLRMYHISEQTCDALINNAASSHRSGLTRSLEYLKNMSCVEQEHPYMNHCLTNLRREYGVEPVLQESHVLVWSWGTLVDKLNFSSCEVLVLDTEGFDVRILRSMISHCKNHEECCWPYVIQFETQGHCDKLEGTNAEWGIIEELTGYGYILICYSHYNTYLALESQLLNNRYVKEWGGQLRCARCWKRHCYPYVSPRLDWKVYCQVCDAALREESNRREIFMRIHELEQENASLRSQLVFALSKISVLERRQHWHYRGW